MLKGESGLQACHLRLIKEPHGGSARGSCKWFRRRVCSVLRVICDLTYCLSVIRYRAFVGWLSGTMEVLKALLLKKHTAPGSKTDGLMEVVPEKAIVNVKTHVRLHNYLHTGETARNSRNGVTITAHPAQHLWTHPQPTRSRGQECGPPGNSSGGGCERPIGAGEHDRASEGSRRLPPQGVSPCYAECTLVPADTLRGPRVRRRFRATS
ncbi:hypothetical protein DPEC_G00139400 [Dallia pectoralis]|uniref:Uncharacterized protein n=1 Tax=Dallia pectoralis TaxID=75939 RepID=A0ACC2GMH1_DALPE|nr:hypothetical protein DPEC_G00139400 [Dallia pectoralis]